MYWNHIISNIILQDINLITSRNRNYFDFKLNKTHPVLPFNSYLLKLYSQRKKGTRELLKIFQILNLTF